MKIQISEKVQEVSLEEIVADIITISKGIVARVQMLKEYPFIPYQNELSQLLTNDTIDRFVSIVSTLDIPYTVYHKKKREDIFSENNTESFEKGLIIQSWSTLGSALESLLQIFLSVYLEQYKDSNWGVWEVQEIDNAKEALNETLDLLVETNKEGNGKGITGKRRKSLKKEINSYLDRKAKILDIKSITLSDLLAFYKTQNIFKDNEADEWVAELNKIREYRNGIHSFQDRIIGDWDEYIHSVKIFVWFLMDIFDRFPEVESEIPLLEDYFIDMRKATRCCFKLKSNR